MILTDLSPVANHLWQSTLCAGVVWVLSLALKNNRAAMRFWLWLAASVKFLIPFSLLVSLGSRLSWRTVPPDGQLQWSMAIDNIARPFAVAVAAPHQSTSTAGDIIPPLLFTIWFCGSAAGVLFWLSTAGATRGRFGEAQSLYRSSCPFPRCLARRVSSRESLAFGAQCYCCRQASRTASLHLSWMRSSHMSCATCGGMII